jgi:AcrR family transcriptional regulator
MAPDEPAADAQAPTEPLSRRELAVARSLDSARARAENRVEQFLDAARQLMDEEPGREFTVQEVVERSGQSLRSFYQYFDGKYELLLALFEEFVRTTADQLAQGVEQEHEPLARLRRFAVDYYDMCRPAPKGRATYSPTMANFAQQLLTEHPKEAARAFTPLVARFEGLLDDAAAAGVIRAGLQHKRITGVVLQAIMFNTFSATIGGTPPLPGADDAGTLWDLLLLGIGTDRR